MFIHSTWGYITCQDQLAPIQKIFLIIITGVFNYKGMDSVRWKKRMMFENRWSIVRKYSFRRLSGSANSLPMNQMASRIVLGEEDVAQAGGYGKTAPGLQGLLL
jgi:hypothetical protein